MSENRYWLEQRYQPRRGTCFHAKKLRELDDESLAKSDGQRFDDESIERWQQELRATSDSEQYNLLLEKMGRIFEWLASRTDPKNQQGRLWAMLYLVRPELVGYETTYSAARRFGYDASALQKMIKEFRCEFPDAGLAVRPGGSWFRPEGLKALKKKKNVRNAGGDTHFHFGRYEAERSSVLQSA